MICPQCGTQNREGDKFCEECGAPLGPNGERPSGITSTGQPAGGAARLVAVGPESPGTFELGHRAMVGRLDSCDVPINHRSVSREHARLSRLRDTYVIEDLGSTNGTLVNGKRIHEAVILRAGDVVTFGSVEFRYETEPAQDSGAAEEAPPAVAEAGAAAAEELPAVPLTFPPLGPFPPPDAEAPSQAGELEPQGAVSQLAPAGPDNAPVLRATPLSDEVEQLANEAMEAAQRLTGLLGQLGARLSDSERARNELEERLSALTGAADALEAARQALREVPPGSLSPDQAAALQQVLSDLSQQPRDVEILMRVGRQASALSATVNESAQLRAVFERISAALEGA